jgi:hypothetical protein
LDFGVDLEEEDEYEEEVVSNPDAGEIDYDESFDDDE